MTDRTPETGTARAGRLALLSLTVVLAHAMLSAGDVQWRAEPALATQLLPPGPMRADFELSVTDAPLVACVEQARGDAGAIEPLPFQQQPWTIERVAPTDGFGTIGGYDRIALTKLFGARRVQLARGPRVVGGRVVGSVTLLAPYPDRTMSRLLHGTLRIVAWLPR